MRTRTDQGDDLAWLLEGCLLQVCASNEWLERRILSLSVDQLRWRPPSGSWSIAANLDHLNRTLDYYLPKMQEALESDRGVKHRHRKCRTTGSEERFVRLMEPPIVEPMSAPPSVLPDLAADPEEIVEQFPGLRIQFAKVVRSVTDVEAGVAIPDSLHPPVHSLLGVIGLLAAHERRHLWHVQQILHSSEFQAFDQPLVGDRGGR